MAKEDFTTLWVQKVTATRITATGEGTIDERINRLIDEAEHSKKRIEELELLLRERTITVPCVGCGTEGIVLNGSEVHGQIRNMAKLKHWACSACAAKVQKACKQIRLQRRI